MELIPPILPQPERSPEFVSERNADNMHATQFASIIAIAVDTATFVARFVTRGRFDSELLPDFVIFVLVFLVSLVYLILTSMRERAKITRSHVFYSLFWVMAIASGTAGWATKLTDVQGLISFAAATFGAAVLFRTHWRQLLWMFSVAAGFMTVYTVLTLGAVGSAKLVVYGIVWTIVALALAVKLERDHIRLFWIRSELAQKNDQLRDLSFKDPLTKLFNRRYLTEVLLHEINAERRYSNGVSVALVDVDHFKRVNDELGHPVGDSVLKELADLMLSTLRDSDIIARYGGEEFVVIFDGCRLSEAITTAERLRSVVERHSFAGLQWTLTVSIGATELRKDDTIESVLKRVDVLLYEAKQQGRNGVAGE